MTPIRTIAVGFDGSSDAQAAARYALELADQLGADLVFVHAAGLLEHIDEPQVVLDLEETVWVLTSEAGIDPGRARWHVHDGDPCSVLLRAGDPPISADLIVVGSRGQGNHVGLPLGSTSHELAEHTTIPILIVPKGKTSNR
jgi:nucleotide-binding universal stress UspA family protein